MSKKHKSSTQLLPNCWTGRSYRELLLEWIQTHGAVCCLRKQQECDKCDNPLLPSACAGSYARQNPKDSPPYLMSPHIMPSLSSYAFHSQCWLGRGEVCYHLTRGKLKSNSWPATHILTSFLPPFFF